MRFLEFHENVSLNRTLPYFLKLVSYTLRLLANHSSAFPEGQSTCNSGECVYILKKGVFISKLLYQSGEPHMYFLVEYTSLSSNFVLFAAHLDVALQVQ